MDQREEQAGSVVSLGPVASRDRYEIVDIIRGFALFGVLLANMFWSSQWLALTTEQRNALPTAAIDRVTSAIGLALVDYKFFTLFSMLFGIGFAMQLSRAAGNERSALVVYRRRLLIPSCSNHATTCKLR